MRAKSLFGYNIEQLNIEKLVKNKFSNLLLSLMGSFTIANLPEGFNQTQFGFKDNNYGGLF